MKGTSSWSTGHKTVNRFSRVSPVPNKLKRFQLPATRFPVPEKRFQSFPIQEYKEGNDLKVWIQAHGGLVHPALAVSDSITCGGRGIVATEDIDLDWVEEQPLIVLPEQLLLTPATAQTLFNDALKDAEVSLQALAPSLQVAVLLAHEWAAGPESFFFPYVQSLPGKSPTAMDMEEEYLQSVLAEIDEECPTRGWKKKIQEESESMDALAELLVEQYAPYLNLTVAAVRRMLGQVMSRSFSLDSGLGMAPLVDLCNHSAQAAAPMMLEHSEGERFLVIWSTQDGDPQPIKAGEELFVNQVPSVKPLEAFKFYGFIPEELVKREARLRSGL